MTENMFDKMSKENASVDASIAEAIQAVSEEQPTDSVFDYTQLRKGGSKPKYERVNLDGQIITVNKAELKLPLNKEWNLSKDKKTKMKSYQFLVYYDTENKDRENYSGVKGFEQDDGSLSKPSLQTNKTKTQASKLFDAYRKYVVKTKGITIEEFDENYGFFELMAFLNTKPKGKIQAVDYEWDDKITTKNMIVEFV